MSAGKKSTRVIFLVDLDAFFASVEEAVNPALKDKPVCIGGNASERGVVSCPNYMARKYGVKTAMPLRTAARLLQGTDAIFLRGNFKLYGEYSEKVFTLVNDFTPDIQQVSLDEAYLDVTECLHFWNNDPVAMARAMKDRIKKELGLTLSVGIASNKVCAKIACDLEKPDGLTVVADGGEAEFLTPLPVERLPGVGKQTLKKMQSLGIRTIGTLARLPVDQIVEMFGAMGQQLHDYANGIDDRILHGPQEEKSISRATTFSTDTDDREFIESVLFYLTEKCCKTLRNKSFAAATVAVTVRFQDFSQQQSQQSRNEPSNIEEELFIDVQNIFQRLWRNDKKVRLVSVNLSHFNPASSQTNLFANQSTKLAILRKTMDDIRAKYGYQIITKGKTAVLQNKFKKQ